MFKPKIIPDLQALIKKFLLNNNTTFIFTLFIILSLILSMLAVNSTENSVNTNAFVHSNISKTVIIDAGHGGFDSGAVVGQILEKDINLKIADCLSEFLRISGFKVICTRTDDSSTESNSTASIATRKKSDLKNRLTLAEKNPDSIFVSIHLNKFNTSSPKGTQIFYGVKSEKSQLLAECIKDSVTRLIQPDNSRQCKKGTKSTFLLYRSPAPTVIVECGFMSNPDDLKLLTDNEYQKQMAFAVFCGILDYYSKGS